jgi:hypothetical protein
MSSSATMPRRSVARGLLVKHVGAVELRVVVAAKPTAAADAVLVANHLPKLGAHPVTALASLHVRNLARRNSLKAGSTRKKKGGAGRGGGSKRNVKKNLLLV